MSAPMLYKVVRPDGTDFHTGTVVWVPPSGIPDGGWMVEHPGCPVHTVPVPDHACCYLSVATVATDCVRMRWPARLLTVEPVGDVWTPEHSMPRKRAARGFRVTGELPGWQALGPQGENVAALIDRVRVMTPGEVERAGAVPGAAQGAAWDAAWVAAVVAARGAAWVAAWVAARDAAWVAAWDAAQVAARYAAQDAAQVAARYAAQDAAAALAVRDLIDPDHYATLTGPMRAAIGDTLTEGVTW